MTVDNFAKEFEEQRPKLKSFILRMMTNVPETEDIVQDTFLKASEKLATFKEESSLKTWVFAIAANLAKDKLRSRSRWTEDVSDICKAAAMSNQQHFGEAMAINTTSPQGTFEIKEHIVFCFTCISKSLPLEQHLVVMLKEVYAFKVGEVAQILELSDAMVKHYLHNGRGKMIDIFEGKCALINKEGTCHQCSELNGIFNPKQNAQEEIVKIKMARDAEKENKEHLFDLRLQLLQENDPFGSKGAELQLHHLEHNNRVMETYLKES